ncbi:AAA family ATPase [Butyricicoccus pullicaecorum]|nr:AAA family ATPase [Butyricicoccus pullicaecorum]
MKIRSLQGHFGNLNGRKIEFSDGFSHLVLPNGWGKSTLCAFLRVMLYGLNTARRDSAAALSDKSKYVPQDGHAMSGRLEIEWNGRAVTIVRETGKGGPMQVFDAFYSDTGEKCRLLTAKNCGQVLLGMGEDAFLSSAMVDGEEVNRPSHELQELITAMAQSGDTNGSTSGTLRQLDRWRLDIDSGTGRGKLPALRTELAELEDQLSRLESITHDIEQQKTVCAQLDQAAQQAQADYEQGYREYTEQLAGSENRLLILRQEHEQRIREISARLPEEQAIREAGEILYGYEGAVRLEKEKREAMPMIETRRRKALEQIEQSKVDREIEVNRTTRPRIRWIAGFFSLVFAVFAAITGVLKIEWFPHMPIVLSGLALFCLLLTFVGSVQKPGAPPDLDGERRRLEMDYQRILDDQQMAASVLLEERSRVIAAAQRLSPDVTTVEQAAEIIRSSMSDLQLLRREQSALGDVMLEIKRAPDENRPPRRLQEMLERLRTRLDDAGRLAEQAHEQLSRLEGQAEAIGKRETLEARFADLQQQAAELQIRYEAVSHAREIIAGENAALSAKISPQITRLAASYLAYLTADNYQEIRLDENFRARTAGADGRLLSELQLSSGARDQLYLALRLAVCQVLTGAKEAPLILDDPFLTSDDARTARGIALLKELGRERQIILLTCRKS